MLWDAENWSIARWLEDHKYDHLMNDEQKYAVERGTAPLEEIIKEIKEEQNEINRLNEN